MRRDERERLLRARNAAVVAHADEDWPGFVAAIADIDDLLGIDTTQAREWLGTMDSMESVGIDKVAGGPDSTFSVRGDGK